MGASPEESMVAPVMGMGMNGVGHLYMQTNASRSCVIRYQRSADGTITQVERRCAGENCTY